MGITRLRNAKQLGTSPNPASVLVSDTSSEASWLAPTIGVNSGMYYKHSTTSWAPFTLGPTISIVGDVMNAVPGAGFYTEIREDGTGVGGGNTIIDFVGAAYTAADAGGGVTSITADATLNALAGFNSNGFLVQTAADTFTARSITALNGYIVIADGDGVAGSPTVGIGANVAVLDIAQAFTAQKTFSNFPPLCAVVPTLGDHLVNKTYVDGLLAGVRRSSVVAATTVPLTLTTDFENGDTLDTVVLVTGDRILIKDQADKTENGIYTVNASGAPTRAVDMNTAAEVDGTMVLVEDGTQEGELWYTVSEVTVLEIDFILFTKIQVGTIGGIGATTQVAFWSDAITLAGNSTFVFDTLLNGGKGALGIGLASPDTTSMLTTLGTTTGNVNFGHVHYNSSANIVYTMSNTGTISIGAVTASQPMVISKTTISRAGAGNGITVIPGVGGSVEVQLSGNTGLGSSLQVSAGAITTTNNFNSLVWCPGGTGFVPVSGNAVFNTVHLQTIIQQTGSASGITRGLYIDSQVAAAIDAADYRGIQIDANASHYALWSTSGKFRIDVGSDVSYDLLYRGAGGQLVRLGMGTTGQVLLANTTAAPTWGSVPVGGGVEEGFIENSTGLTHDLDLAGVVKDKDGNNVIFTIPSNPKLFHVYLNGQKLNRGGTGNDRDYSVDGGTHVLTLKVALVATDVLYIYKHG